MEKKYRIITNDEVFVVELFQSWTYRGGWFFLKKVTQERWVPCDCIGGDCSDENGFKDPYEVVKYDSLDEAKAKIRMWTMPTVSSPDWKVVWP